MYARRFADLAEGQARLPRTLKRFSSIDAGLVALVIEAHKFGLR